MDSKYFFKQNQRSVWSTNSKHRGQSGGMITSKKKLEKQGWIETMDSRDKTYEA